MSYHRWEVFQLKNANCCYHVSLANRSFLAGQAESCWVSLSPFCHRIYCRHALSCSGWSNLCFPLVLWYLARNEQQCKVTMLLIVLPKLTAQIIFLKKPLKFGRSWFCNQVFSVSNNDNDTNSILHDLKYQQWEWNYLKYLQSGLIHKIVWCIIIKKKKTLKLKNK